MKTREFFIAGMAALALASNALAHHSHAYYVPSEEKIVHGTVKEFDWRNPHSWITIVVADEASGEALEWAFEARAPNMLSSQGWSADSLKPGDEIAVTFRPLINGGTGGLLREITLADGTILSDR
nr:MAG: hypothetical protein E4H34_02255 [Hyphomicrobiales bacterium]